MGKQSSWVLFVGLWAGAVSCDRSPELPARIAEPEAPLRPPAERGTVPDDARVVDTVIKAKLDAEAHQIQATATMTWRNRTSRSVSELPFHLYINGFRAEDTEWMRSARGRSGRLDSDFTWGYIDVAAVRLLGSGDARELSFQEQSDPSLMTVTLPEPVPGGGELTIELEFVTQLPRVIARTGYADDFHMVAQWFPKIGVLDDRNGWQAHVFTTHSEFFADFGSYEVELDVPADMVVGATGVRTAEQQVEDRRVLSYRAEMVHDFAWVADPNLVVVDGEHDGIRIRQLMPAERASDAPTHFEAQAFTLDSMQNRYGPYPWSTITIVHPPPGAGAAGGMEYPTLFTTSNVWRIPGPVRQLWFDERVSGTFTTVHEFGHQYFQGMLASNEFAQPWLDEGMNTMSNALALFDAYGDDPWLFKAGGHEFYASDVLRMALQRKPLMHAIDESAAAFDPYAGDYGTVVYRKTAALMLTLRNLVGADAFDRALATYAERWRFRHPTGDDLARVLVEVLGEQVELGAALDGSPVRLDLPAYLAQGLHDTTAIDFRVHRVAEQRQVGAGGWHRDADGALAGGEVPDSLGDYASELPADQIESVVVIRRAGGFRVPVEIMVELDDGSSERTWWDGQAPYTTLTWPGRRVVMATIDPDRKLYLEAERTDNTAYVPGSFPDHGLSDTIGDFTEAMSLALLGGFGP